MRELILRVLLACVTVASIEVAVHAADLNGPTGGDDTRFVETRGDIMTGALVGPSFSTSTGNLFVGTAAGIQAIWNTASARSTSNYAIDGAGAYNDGGSGTVSFRTSNTARLTQTATLLNATTATQLDSSLDARGAIKNDGASNSSRVFMQDADGMQLHNGSRSVFAITAPGNDVWIDTTGIGGTNSTQYFTTTAANMLYGIYGAIGSNSDRSATQEVGSIGDNMGAGGVAFNRLLTMYGAGAIGFPQVQTVTGTTTLNLDPQSHRIEGSCSSACAVTMQETSAALGQEFCFHNTGSFTMTFPDVTNVFVAPSFVDTTGLGANDSFCARYVTGAYWLVYFHEDI